MKSRALWYAFAGLLWVAVPLVASAAGLVPCDTAATCNICTFGKLIQNIINFAIGLSIPLAAIMFSYAGWLYFSNRENTSKIEKAHTIFRTVFIGFCIAIAGWLIVQTILKTLAPGYQSWTTFSCTANRPMDKTISGLFQQSGLPGLTSVAPPLGNQNYGGQINASTGCIQGDNFSDGQCGNAFGGYYQPASTANCDPELGCFNNVGAANGDIAAAAAARLNNEDDTSAGPEGGNKACAWEVNRILEDAGVPPIDGSAVGDMEKELNNGRGTFVMSTADSNDYSNTKEGDLVIWKDYANNSYSHVGICLNDGCGRVASNSSGNASFSTVTNANFNSNWQARIYHVNR